MGGMLSIFNLGKKFRPTFNKPQKQQNNAKANTTKSLYHLLRFTSPIDAINNLEGDMRIGAIIMYNTLNND